MKTRPLDIGDILLAIAMSLPATFPGYLMAPEQVAVGLIAMVVLPAIVFVGVLLFVRTTYVD